MRKIDLVVKKSHQRSKIAKEPKKGIFVNKGDPSQQITSSKARGLNDLDQPITSSEARG